MKSKQNIKLVGMGHVLKQRFQSRFFSSTFVDITACYSNSESSYGIKRMLRDEWKTIIRSEPQCLVGSIGWRSFSKNHTQNCAKI